MGVIRLASNNVIWRLVAAAEQREAAFEDGVLANPVYAVCLNDRVVRVYDGFAAERSLAGSTAATGVSLS
jgi:hypothetical protein